MPTPSTPSSGELLWKTHIDEHPHASITGAPVYYEARVYVPLVAAEEGTAMNPKYECCSARGGVIALDALTGKQIWKTYTIDETPHPVSKSSAGTMMWGPSGASIWSAPTIDPEHHRIYVGTGDNFSKPATKMSDAIIALNMDTGKIEWAQAAHRKRRVQHGLRTRARRNPVARTMPAPTSISEHRPFLVKLRERQTRAAGQPEIRRRARPRSRS